MIKLRSLVLVLAMLSPGLLKAQFFADELRDFGECNTISGACNPTVINPDYAVDSKSTNFTNLSVDLVENQTAYIEVGFSTPAPAGSFVAAVLVDSNGTPNQQLLQIFFINYYTADDSLVLSTAETYQQNVPALAGNTDTFLLANVLPEGNYEVKYARLELRDTSNVDNDIRIFGVFYYQDDEICGPHYADSLIASANCSDSMNIVDGSDTTWALFNLPTGLNVSATATVKLDGLQNGDYAAFEIAPNDTLGLGVAPQLTIEILDNNNLVVATRTDILATDFSTLASNDRTYLMGIYIPPGNDTIAAMRLTLNQSVAADEKLRVYRAIGVNFEERIPIDTTNAGICLGEKVILTAVGPYTDFRWSTGATTRSIEVTSGGLYYVEGLNASGCKRSGAIQVDAGIINAPAGITTSACGDSTGTITPRVTGGTGTLMYLWDDGTTTLNRTGLKAGFYTLSITDSITSCSQNFTYAVSDDKPAYVSVEVDSATCANNDGAINLNVIGIAPFTYQYDFGFAADTVRNLAAGDYTVIVTDGNGCKSAHLINVPSKSGLSIASVITQPTCGKSDGKVAVTVSGGSGAYDYLWSSGVTNQDLDTVGYGYYSLMVTDIVTGCTKSMSVNLDNVGAGNYNILEFQNESCGGGDGKIHVEAMPKHVILWSDGSRSFTRDSLEAGLYTFRIFQVNGDCHMSGGLEIKSYERPQVRATVINSCNTAIQFNDGRINLEQYAGSPITQVDWSNGDNGMNIGGLDTGIYIATFTDAFGCTQTVCSEIKHRVCSDVCDVEFFEVLTPNEDGFNDSWVVTNLLDCPDNDLEIYNRYGSVVYRDHEYMNDWKGTGLRGENLPEGTYFYILKVNFPTEAVYKGMISLKHN